MGQYENKRVFVTGAGQGIGYAICKAFAEEGAIVGLNDAQPELAQQGAAELNALVGAERVFAYPGDVADPTTVYVMIEEFTQQHGVPHVVVANAGITKYIEFLECTPEIFDKVTQVNLRGSYFLAQAAAKKMIAAEIPGRIILMSSVVGWRAFLNFSVYSMTKAALQMMAKSLALGLGQHRITVNSISPGAILTERTKQEDPNYAENWSEVIVTGRVGTVEDIAHTTLFLASPAASQITGQDLLVDGGWSLRSPVPAEHPEKPVDE